MSEGSVSTPSTSSSSTTTTFSTCSSGSGTSFETAAETLPPPQPDVENFPKLHSYPAKTVAEELTLLDASLLRMIKTAELEDGVWMKKDKKETSAPNIMAMVKSFNRVALLVPTEILEGETPQARAKVITAYIKIAQECYSHRNYNSLKAVLAGLQSTPIFRLNKSWKEVTSKKKRKFDQLTSLMHEDNNWSTYREELASNLASNTPFVPFLGVFLTTTAFQQTAMARGKRLNSVSFTSDNKAGSESGQIYETYHLLEPITVRQKLSKLREASFENEDGVRSSSSPNLLRRIRPLSSHPSSSDTSHSISHFIATAPIASSSTSSSMTSSSTSSSTTAASGSGKREFIVPGSSRHGKSPLCSVSERSKFDFQECQLDDDYHNGGGVGRGVASSKSVNGLVAPRTDTEGIGGEGDDFATKPPNHTISNGNGHLSKLCNGHDVNPQETGPQIDDCSASSPHEDRTSPTSSDSSVTSPQRGSPPRSGSLIVSPTRSSSLRASPPRSFSVIGSPTSPNKHSKLNSPTSKSMKVSSSDVSIRRKLFPRGKRSHSHQKIPIDHEEVPDGPISSVQSLPVLKKAPAGGVKSGIKKRGSVPSHSGGLWKKWRGQSKVTPVNQDPSLIDQPKVTPANQDPSLRGQSKATPVNQVPSSDTGISRSSKQENLMNDVKPTAVNEPEPKPAPSVSDEAKKQRTLQRRVSVISNYSNGHQMVVKKISGSLECLLEAVETELQSERRKRISSTSLPRSPSWTALHSVEARDSVDTVFATPSASSSLYFDPSSHPPEDEEDCLSPQLQVNGVNCSDSEQDREGGMVMDSLPPSHTPSLLAAITPNSHPSRTHSCENILEARNRASDEEKVVNGNGDRGSPRVNGGGEKRKGWRRVASSEKSPESCESTSSFESAHSTFQLHLPSFRRHRRNSSHPNFSFLKNDDKEESSPKEQRKAVKSPSFRTAPLHKKISSIIKGPSHSGSPAARQRACFQTAVHHFGVLKLGESNDPGDRLHHFQFLSLGCCAQIDSCSELRRVLTQKPHNTEAANYKLSYKMEPI